MGGVFVNMEKIELRYRWEHGNEKNKTNLVERKAFVDKLWIKSADSRDKFLI